MFVQSSGALPAGVVAQATVHVPSGPPLSCAARVLRVSGEDCMGMQFENVTSALSEGLQEFLLPLIPAKSESRLSRPQAWRPGGTCTSGKPLWYPWSISHGTHAGRRSHRISFFQGLRSGNNDSLVRCPRKAATG
jgi:hypothetical protein